MFKDLLILFVLLMSSIQTMAANPMRYDCTSEVNQIFEIQIFDLEYKLAFLNQAHTEQIVLSFNEEGTYFFSKFHLYSITFDDLSLVDDDGEGQLSGLYKFPANPSGARITCQAFGF